MSASLTRVLTDTNTGHWDESFHCDASTLSLPGTERWSVRKSTLHGGTSEGVDLVELDNGAMTVEVLPTRGMGIFRLRVGDRTIGWQSPATRPVHPSFVNLSERGGLGWLYGFNELLCRCGLAFNGPPCDDDGQPLTLHGRIANLPAGFVETVVDDADGTLRLRGTVDEDYLFGPGLRLNTTIETGVGTRRLRIIDEVENLSSGPRPFELLYHINCGRPVLEGGAKFAMPIARVAPRDATAAQGLDNLEVYLPPKSGVAEEAFFIQPATNSDGKSVALIYNASCDLGFAVRFDTVQLPWFTLWKCPQADGEGYVTGLEPGVNLPNPRPFERAQGRVPVLAAGSRYRAELELEVLTDSATVRGVVDEIESLKEGVDAVRHREPHPELSASV